MVIAHGHDHDIDDGIPISHALDINFDYKVAAVPQCIFQDFHCYIAIVSIASEWGIECPG